VPGSSVIRGAKHRPVSHERICTRAEKYHIHNRAPEGLALLLDNLCNLHDYIVQSEDMRFAASRNTTIAYTNNIDTIHELLAFDKTGVITEASVTCEPGTIYRKNSEYKYRIPFRHVKCGKDVRENIAKFLTSYDADVRSSGSLLRWAFGKYWWQHTETHFFIDVNDAKMQVVLDLMAPGVTSKIYTIISDK